MTCAKSGVGELLTARCDCGHVYAAHGPHGCSICAAVAQLLHSRVASVGPDEHLVLRFPGELDEDAVASLVGNIPPALHGRVVVVSGDVEAYVVSPVPVDVDG